MIDREKIIKGRFFTKTQLWLKPQVEQFIRESNCTIAYDPFAGYGDLLSCHSSYGIKETTGLDIDETMGWQFNDSLLHIPHIERAIIITNPPYLSNYSASRKKVMSDVALYFKNSEHDNLYLIALDRMLEAQTYVVALVPETFLNALYPQKNKLHSLTVLEENPFEDTDSPVCVVCFDGIPKSPKTIKVYKNEDYIMSLEELESMRPKAKHTVAAKFNAPDGWLGLRAVDTTDPNNTIKFDLKENFDYDWEKGIKISSRLLSTISIEVSPKDRPMFIKRCNDLLSEMRKKTNDLILSPFKGNMKNGVRRRRLDYYTARAIMEKAYEELFGTSNI